MQDLLQGTRSRAGQGGRSALPPSLPRGLQAPPGPGPAQARPGPASSRSCPAAAPRPLLTDAPHPLLGPALQGHPLTFTARAHGADLGEVPQMLLPGFFLLFRAALPSWPLCVSFHPVPEPHASWHCPGVNTRQAGVE